MAFITFWNQTLHLKVWYYYCMKHVIMCVSPGLVENIQQQVFGARVLLCVSSVQINEGALEVRSHFRERSQLDQVQEVQVLQSARALALRLRRVEALPELVHVGTPD